jgi:Co/Zn/Cd efflux system component
VESCCQRKACELDALRDRQRGVLRIVLAINAVMFLVEAAGGLVARSSALLADSLDMLGDAAVYATTLAVLHRSPLARGRAALLKGLAMAALGGGVLVATVLHLVGTVPPRADGMGVVGGMALAANLVCLVLLTRHRADDLNMRSTWLCSRNDIIANLAVLAAALLVGLLGSRWPDILVGFGIAALFLRSSAGVIASAGREIRAARLAAASPREPSRQGERSNARSTESSTIAG